MAPRSTLGGIQTLDMIDALGAVGVDTRVVCRELGLDVARMREGASVPSTRVLELLTAAERQVRDPWIGLHAGRHSLPHDPLVYLLLSCATLEEGIRKAAGFAPLIISTLGITLVSRHDASSIVFDLNDRTLATSRHLTGYMLMTVLGALRTAAVDRLDPRAVHVCIPDPGDGAERRAFGCPVHFGQPDMRLVFASRDLGRAPRVANRLVAREIEKLSAALLAEVRSVASLQARMAESTRLLLATGVRPQRARVARRLGMSDRTLQRGLEREGTTFKRARDAIVREVVQALLLNPSIKIEEVARSIGFAEVGAFSKAFKRWTGCTPSAYREQIGPQTQDGGRASSAAGGPQEGEC